MKQISFGDSEYLAKKKKTRREIFLEEMEQVVPWATLLKLVEPHYPVAGWGRQPYPLQTMLRVHLIQNWFGLSDPGMEEALYDRLTPNGTLLVWIDNYFEPQNPRPVNIRARAQSQRLLSRLDRGARRPRDCQVCRTG